MPRARGCRKLRRWDVARAFPDVSQKGKLTKNGYYRRCVKTNGFLSAPLLLRTNGGNAFSRVFLFLRDEISAVL